MSNMHDKSLAVPVLQLADGEGNIVYYGNEPVSNRFSELVYEYCEGREDDKCTLTFVFPSSEKNIMDLASLATDRLIKIRWGYLNHGWGPWRIVAVRDDEAYYETKSHIKWVLKCTDVPSYLKASRLAIDEISDFKSWLDRIANGRFVVVTNIIEAMHDDGVRPAFRPNPEDYINGGYITTAIDNTAVAQVYASKFTVIVPGDQSDWDIIEQHVNTQEGANLYVNGRDDKLSVEEFADFNQPVIRGYNIQKDLKGVIKSFRPFTKFKENKKDQDEQIVINNQTGEVIGTTRVEGVNDNDPLLVNTATGQTFEMSSSRYSGINAGSDYVDETGVPKHLKGEEYTAWKVEGIREEFREFAKEIYQHNATAPPDQQRFITEFFVSERFPNQSIPTSILIKDPGLYEDVRSLAANEIARREYLKRKCILKIIGDASIESGKVISIQGVAQKHSGKYYIEKATHRWNVDGGAVTILECIKEVNAKVIVELIDSGDTPEEGDFINKIKPWINSREQWREWQRAGRMELQNLGSDFDIQTSLPVPDSSRFNENTIYNPIREELTPEEPIDEFDINDFLDEAPIDVKNPEDS